MRYFTQGRFQQQASFLRRQFLQDGDLPFTNVLTEETISQALTAITVCWLDRIFSPLVTLWVFLGQVLSADHSCRSAVARLIAHRISRGQSPCSAETGAYCQARKRLPEKFFSDVARQTGRALEAKVDPKWLWKRRRVYVYDGSSVTMPDTSENQSAYPQPVAQKPGLGFPLARIAAVFSLACGAVVDLGICRYAGKGQSELGMLRTLWNLFRPGDVMLADFHLPSPAFVRVLGKGKKERLCPLLPQTARVVSRFLEAAGRPVEERCSLFQNRRGEKLTRQGARYLLRQYLNQAAKVMPTLNRAGISLHTLRHTKAMHLLQSDVPIITIKDVLGHADVRSTEVYVQTDLEAKRKALEKAGTPSKVPRRSKTIKPDILNWLQSL